jgi:hypothetical protein
MMKTEPSPPITFAGHAPMSAESRSPSLEDAYAEGRKDERAAIVEMLLGMYSCAQWSPWYFARLIAAMDIQPKDTDAKP